MSLLTGMLVLLYFQRSKLVSEFNSQRMTIKKHEKTIQELLKELDVSMIKLIFFFICTLLTVSDELHLQMTYMYIE